MLFDLATTEIVFFHFQREDVRLKRHHVRLVLLKPAEFTETTIARADNPNGSPGAESRVTKVNPFGETREPLNIYGATVSGIDFMVTSTWPSNNELRGGTGLSEPRRSRSIAFPVNDEYFSRDADRKTQVLLSERMDVARFRRRLLHYSAADSRGIRPDNVEGTR